MDSHSPLINKFNQRLGKKKSKACGPLKQRFLSNQK